MLGIEAAAMERVLPMLRIRVSVTRRRNARRPLFWGGGAS
jgi:hypothetical protein